MTRWRPIALVLLAAAGAGGAAGPLAGQEPSDRPAEAPPAVTRPPAPLPTASPASSDPRSHVLLRLDCASRVGRREITLFGNGTVRSRSGPPGHEEMRLGEIGPDELAATLDQLGQEDLSEVDPDPLTVEGDWVESCLLELDLPRPAAIDRAGERGRPPMGPAGSSGSGGRLELRFGRYSSLPLALSRVVQVADRLGEVAEKELPPGLPVGYEPRRGDVLARADGARFEVVGFTSDGKGVELEGVDNPLTLYLASGDLPRSFVGLVSRSSRFEVPPVEDASRDRRRGPAVTRGPGRVRASGGAHRGRWLAVPPGARPTEGRVREALFSIWQAPLAEGASLLDLFAGSGVVGLEAAGRGALRVVCVDADRRAFPVLQSNRDRLGEALVDVRRLDLPAGLGELALRGEGPFDLVFADPPYRFTAYSQLLEAAEPLLAEQGEAAIEHSVRATLPDEVGGLIRVDQRRYGECALSFYRRLPRDRGAGASASSLSRRSTTRSGSAAPIAPTRK